MTFLPKKQLIFFPTEFNVADILIFFCKLLEGMLHLRHDILLIKNILNVGSLTNWVEKFDEGNPLLQAWARCLFQRSRQEFLSFNLVLRIKFFQTRTHFLKSISCFQTQIKIYFHQSRGSRLTQEIWIQFLQSSKQNYAKSPENFLRTRNIAQLCSFPPRYAWGLLIKPWIIHVSPYFA